jgi:toxin ParE1/3/4
MAKALLKATLLESGEVELKRLRRYVVGAFGLDVWENSYAQIKTSIKHIRSFPESGHVLDVLGPISGNKFREVVSGQNRIVYEVEGDIIYVHLIVDTRRDLIALMQNIVMQAM